MRIDLIVDQDTLIDLISQSEKYSTLRTANATISVGEKFNIKIEDELIGGKYKIEIITKGGIL